MSDRKIAAKPAYKAPVLQVLPTDETMGKTIAKGGEGFYNTVADVLRSKTGNGASGAFTPMAGYDGGADSKVNYDES